MDPAREEAHLLAAQVCGYGAFCSDIPSGNFASLQLKHIGCFAWGPLPYHEKGDDFRVEAH